jgi:hypothetical protein
VSSAFVTADVAALAAPLLSEDIMVVLGFGGGLRVSRVVVVESIIEVDNHIPLKRNATYTPRSVPCSFMRDTDTTDFSKK